MLKLNIKNCTNKNLDKFFIKKNDACLILNYAAYVLNDRLKDRLHNFMILKNLEENECAQQYFKWLKIYKKENLGAWGNYL